MTFGHDSNIRISPKVPETNEMVVVKLRAMMDESTSNPVSGRITA